MAHIPETPTKDIVPDKSVVEAFEESHSVSESRHLKALGYGPYGSADPNFSPTFRRHYYLTVERLHDLLDYLVENGDSGDDNDLTVNTLTRDIQWFIRKRGTIEGAA
jgi:hypothetical protein